MGISRNYLYDQVELFNNAGSYTWSKPSNIDDSKPILVHVWGAGGTGNDVYVNNPTEINSCGGGGGGLAVKEIAVSALGSTETITVGDGKLLPTAVGGTSSFGSHCSATGGNGGAYNTQNTSGTYNDATHVSPTVANPVAGTATDLGGRGTWRNNVQGASNTYYGQGGMGIGGDINRRGGWGGIGYYSTTDNNGGGGGGSAPAPYGWSHGYDGGIGYTYAGGGGGGIGQYGSKGDYEGGAGGGSARGVNLKSSSPTSYYTCNHGGTGVAGHGGTPMSSYHGYVGYGGDAGRKPYPGQGLCLIEPNQILLGGGGGGCTMEWVQSSGMNCHPSSHGGPGGGGGGIGCIAANTSSFPVGGMGGLLGGGGGSYQYGAGGNGGNAGGGGGCGYYAGANTPHDMKGGTSSASYMWYGPGGDGLIIIQYATK